MKKVVDPVSRLRRDGLAALRAGQAVAAENHFEKLVLIDPSDPEPHLYLHAALKAQSRDEAARNALVEGLKLTATPSRLAKVLAHDFLAAGLVDSALTVLTRHRPADADDPDYDANLAAVNQRAGHHTAAAELYLRLVADQPANGDWWVGLAISQEAQGLLQDATRSFATAAAAGTLDLRLARYAAERLEELEKGS